MTDQRKLQLKEQGFLQAENRFVTFVHEFSGYENKGMCNHFNYVGGVCRKTDNGTCRFAHITSFRNLAARDANALTAWVRDTPGVSFVRGRGPTSTG